MPAYASPFPSGRELGVMHALWELGHGDVAGVREKFNALYEPPVAYTTIASMLSRLTAKRFVDFEIVGNRHIYFPVIDRDKARREAVDRLIDDWFGYDQEALRRLLQERIDQRAARIQRRNDLARRRAESGVAARELRHP